MGIVGRANVLQLMQLYLRVCLSERRAQVVFTLKYPLARAPCGRDENYPGAWFCMHESRLETGEAHQASSHHGSCIATRPIFSTGTTL